MESNDGTTVHLTDYGITIEEITWKTKDGRELPISQLPDDHLDNIILYLENRKRRNFYWEGIMKAEKRRREQK